MARPIPDAPPVISAVLPSSFIGIFPLGWRTSSRTVSKKCDHALACFGVSRQPSGCFAFAGITAAVRITCRRNTLLAAAQRGGRKGCDAMHDCAGTGRDVVVRSGPLRQPKLNRIGANDDLRAENQARGDGAAAHGRAGDLRHGYLRQSFDAVV